MRVRMEESNFCLSYNFRKWKYPNSTLAVTVMAVLLITAMEALAVASMFLFKRKQYADYSNSPIYMRHFAGNSAFYLCACFQIVFEEKFQSFLAELISKFKQKQVL